MIETVDQKQLFQKGFSIRFCTVDWALNDREIRCEAQMCVGIYMYNIYSTVAAAAAVLLLLLLFLLLVNADASPCGTNETKRKQAKAFSEQLDAR